MYAYILGNNSTSFAEKVMASSDLNDIRGYSSIGEFVSVAERQGLQFKRVVVLVQVVQREQEFVTLARYFKEVSPRSECVLLARQFEDADKVILDWYYSVFSSPIYIDYSLALGEATSNWMLKNLLTMPVDEIRINHSFKRGNKPKVRLVGSGNNQEAVSTKQEIQASPPVVAKNGVIKSFSFGGKLFGKKKLTKAQKAEISRIEVEANALLALVSGGS